MMTLELEKMEVTEAKPGQMGAEIRGLDITEIEAGSPVIKPTSIIDCP